MDTEELPMGKMRCRKCNRVKDARKEFFMGRDGNRVDLCKECMTQHINNKDPETFMWILKEFDVPYIEKEWIKIYNDTMSKKGKVPCNGVIGKYFRLMKIQQYNKYRYADTDSLNGINLSNDEEVAARILANDPKKSEEFLELQRQLDAGEITQAQFDTLSPLQIQDANVSIDFIEAPDAMDEEKEILKSLTADEVKMLKLKWGNRFKPSQWVRLEDMYLKYSSEYELNIDREENLKQICKLYIKMDEALDIGDIGTYKSLSAAYDMLRKSSKFTEAQNKEGTAKYLDSIGELVAFCEREGGIIEQIPHPDDYPQDDIDYAIKNMKAYYYDVVTNELGLGNMIEAYIKRLEQSEKEQEIDFESGLITSQEEFDAELVNDKTADEFSDYLEYGIEEEIAQILGEE